MFLSRKAYDDLRNEWLKAHAECTALSGVNAQLNAHIEWMRVRLTQLEYERAQLLRKYMGLDVPTPTFDAPDEHPDPNQTMDFSDVGDAMADKLGIGWNPDGTLKYEEKQ